MPRWFVVVFFLAWFHLVVHLQKSKSGSQFPASHALLCQETLLQSLLKYVLFVLLLRHILFKHSFCFLEGQKPTTCIGELGPGGGQLFEEFGTGLRQLLFKLLLGAGNCGF